MSINGRAGDGSLDLAPVGITAELGTRLRAFYRHRRKPRNAATHRWHAGLPDPNDTHRDPGAPARWRASGEVFQQGHRPRRRRTRARQIAGRAQDVWSKIVADIADNDAAWVPLFNPNRYSLRSERLKGDISLFQDIIAQPFPFDAVWVE
jgi:hypothetical protein